MSDQRWQAEILGADHIVKYRETTWGFGEEYLVILFLA
jgi:hypothetical protein